MRAPGGSRGWILQDRVKRTILSSRLRKARRQLGLTEEQIAAQTGLAAQRVLDLEQGCCDMPEAEIRAVAGALDVKIEHLL